MTRFNRRTSRVAISCCIIAALFLFPGFIADNAHASGDAAPADLPDYFFSELADINDVMPLAFPPRSENAMLIDARPYRPKYVKGHIPMAVSIPDSQFDKKTDLLPKDKAAQLIFYCEGPKCKLSHKSARKAQALGYTNIKVYAEGFPGWMKEKGTYASVSAEWVKKQIDSGDPMLLIDSRPRRPKYDKGHIPTAISISDSQFDKLKGLLPSDKNILLVFYCGGHHCRLSHKSAKKAIEMGYANVKVFSGGFPEWKALMKETGGQVESAAPAAEAETGSSSSSVKSGKEEGSVDLDYFKDVATNTPDSVMLIDVRDADEFKKASVKGSVNIPVDDLEKQIPSLPADKPIIFICGTGARSGESYYMVQDLRPALKNVFYLDAAMTVKKDGSFTLKKPGTE